MTEEEVIELYDALCANGVAIWIDGGWCVDALLGVQTRGHTDLDFAVRRRDEATTRAVLIARGFANDARDERTNWNYVMKDTSGRSVDVHVFEYDEHGRNTYGVAYPHGSLTGTGTLAGREVRCVAAEWMFRFKTAYSPSDKDIHDVERLAEKFAFTVPATHRKHTRSTDG